MGATAGVKWERFDLSLFVTNLLNQDKVLQRPNIAGLPPSPQSPALRFAVCSGNFFAISWAPSND